MLDIRWMRENREALAQAMEKLNDSEAPWESALELDGKRRELLQQGEKLREERNTGSRQIGVLFRENKTSEANALKERMSQIGDEIARIDDEGADDLAPPAPGRDPAGWWDVVSAMAPAGVTAMILKNSNLTDRSAEHWLIRLDQSHESLLNDKQRAEIGRLATHYAGRELRVDFEIGQLETETPMARESRIAKEAREKAEATLMADPNVRAMLDEFGGTLDSARLSDGAGETEGLR